MQRLKTLILHRIMQMNEVHYSRRGIDLQGNQHFPYLMEQKCLSSWSTQIVVNDWDKLMCKLNFVNTNIDFKLKFLDSKFL